MDHETTKKLHRELSPGESLLWSGRPKQGIHLRGADAFMIPFSLLWGGFAIFWEYGVYKSGAPAFFLLFGGVFVLVGVYFIFGRFMADSLKRKGTYYGVTNDRVLILSEFPTRTIKSLNLKTLSDITFSHKSDGSGSISFGPQNPMAGWMGGMAWPGMGQYQSPGFELIKDVKGAYDILREAQKKAP
jgi:hypothetical protein